jgi:osmotically-inducible protein OsmY
LLPLFFLSYFPFKCKIMADNHRNQGRDRSRNQDWNENSNQQRNSNQGYGSQENQYTGNNSRYGQQSDQGDFGNNWNRESYYRDSGSDRYNQNSGNQNENYGYGGREYGSEYGGGNYQGNSSYYNSGSYGNSGRPSYGSSRNLYDRDYEGQNREGNRSNYSGLGGANYGGDNESRGRRGSYNEDRSYRGYSGSNYGGNYDSQRGRYAQEDSNDRSWWDRTRDEVSGWFGDEDAEKRRERDRQQNHRGKGPRNYSRSDDRIKEDVNDRLSDDPWIDATEIDVTVSNGEVTLTGTVNERTAKRRAEDIAEQVSGVKNVENRIRVGQNSSRDSSDTGSSAVPSGNTSSTTTEKNKAKSGYITG